MADPPSFISLANAQAPLFVGVDVGGTNIKFGLLDHAGKTLAYHSVPTESERGPDDATRRIAGGVEHLLKQVGATSDHVGCVGLATPGPMDLQAGLLINPGNLRGWWDFPIRDRVSEQCGLPVRFANDANAAAYGEYWRGAGSQFHSMVLLTLGTGIGGGIIVGDLLIEGVHGCGSECGHLLIDFADDAPRDSLDKTGSLEAYCGSYGVIRRTMDALNVGRDSRLAAIVSQGEPLTPRDIAAAAESGDALAREVVMDTARYLAMGIVSLIHTIDPDSVVLGGAMTFGGAGHALGEEFLQRIRDEVSPRIFKSLRADLRIDFAQLGGDAGYIGAAGLARLAHSNTALAH